MEIGLVIDMLVKQGASIYAADKERKTPLSYVNQECRARMIDIWYKTCHRLSGSSGQLLHEQKSAVKRAEEVTLSLRHSCSLSIKKNSV